MAAREVGNPSGQHRVECSGVGPFGIGRHGGARTCRRLKRFFGQGVPRRITFDQAEIDDAVPLRRIPVLIHLAVPVAAKAQRMGALRPGHGVGDAEDGLLTGVRQLVVVVVVPVPVVDGRAGIEAFGPVDAKRLRGVQPPAFEVVDQVG